MLITHEPMSAQEQYATVFDSWDLSGSFPLPRRKLIERVFGEGSHALAHSFSFARDVSDSYGSDYFCTVGLRCLETGELRYFHVPVSEAMYAEHGDVYLRGILANGEVESHRG